MRNHGTPVHALPPATGTTAVTAVMIFDTDFDVVLSLALLRCRSFVVLCAQEISSLNAGSLTHDKLRKLWRAVCSFATKQLSQNRVQCLHHKYTLCCLAGQVIEGPLTLCLAFVGHRPPPPPPPPGCQCTSVWTLLEEPRWPPTFCSCRHICAPTWTPCYKARRSKCKCQLTACAVLCCAVPCPSHTTPY